MKSVNTLQNDDALNTAEESEADGKYLKYIIALTKKLIIF
jgi:hypothetical protein